MTKDGFSMRDAAMLAGGLAAGILGSRLLPPILMQAVGAARVKMGEDPFENLIQDHRYVASLLDEMQQVGPDSNINRMRLFLSLKRSLSKHALAEEDIVYPLLADEIGDVEGANHLFHEHAEIKIHLFELERLVKKGEDWRDRIGQLSDVIRDHVKDEEEKEFPKLRQALDERRSRLLGQHIQREKAMVL